MTIGCKFAVCGDISLKIYLRTNIDIKESGTKFGFKLLILRPVKGSEEGILIKTELPYQLLYIGKTSRKCGLTEQ